MNKKDLVMLIMAHKTLDYEKDPNPDNWVTISGAKVHLDEGGKINGGAKGKFNGKSYSGTKKQRKPGAGTNTGTAESSKKYESKAREAVEYWLHTHYKTESDKNIYASVESVRSQMEYYVKSAERNLNDAKKTGKEDLIKKYQDKFDEAKGTLEALNNYYDGGTVKKEPETKTESKQGTTKSLSGASMEKVTQAFYNAYQNEKDEKVKQELKMWHDVAKDDPDGEYKGDTVKFLRDVIEGLNWDKGVNKYNPKEKAVTDKKRKALLKIIKGLKETGSKANAKKEEWRKNNNQLKLFDRKPKR